jgi:DNA modification methylase
MGNVKAQKKAAAAPPKKKASPTPVPDSAERRVEYVKLSDVVPADRNPKTHDIGEIQNSLRRAGFGEAPMRDDRTGKLVAGHGRLEALTKMKEAGEPPPSGVRIVGDEWAMPVQVGWASKNDREAEAYLLASNETTTRGGWDTKELSNVLRDLARESDGLLGTGFSGQAFDNLMKGLAPTPQEEKDKDEVPEVDAKDVYVQRGEIYRLGDHLIMCGSSVEATDVNQLMGKDLARMMLTDPPWNVAYEGKTKKKLTISNDDLGEDFAGFLALFCVESARVLEPGALVYVVMSTSEWPTVDRALRAGGFRWSDTIIWNKDSLVLSRGDYHKKYEPIWYGWKDGAARLKELKDRTQSNVWDVDRPTRSADHPTTKPVALLERALWNSSNARDVVYEPFSGSGSTLMACETTGRLCRAMELEPRFVQVAIERWQKYTGRAAEKL